jgi:hypothetical protein
MECVELANGWIIRSGNLFDYDYDDGEDDESA